MPFEILLLHKVRQTGNKEILIYTQLKVTLKKRYNINKLKDKQVFYSRFSTGDTVTATRVTASAANIKNFLWKLSRNIRYMSRKEKGKVSVWHLKCKQIQLNRKQQSHLS